MTPPGKPKVGGQKKFFRSLRSRTCTPHLKNCCAALAANVSVSPVLDELLLGSDWLVQNKCRWDFAAATVFIGDQLIKTYQKKHTNVCRRIFVAERCVVPPRHEANIPVRMMYDNIHYPKTEWAVKPRVLRPGVVAARTLLNDDRTDVVVRILNYSCCRFGTS